MIQWEHGATSGKVVGSISVEVTGLSNWPNLFSRRRDSDWLRAGRQRSRSSSLGRVRDFLFSMSSRLAPASYTMGTGGSFPEVKRPGRKADHSPPTSAEVKKI